MFQESHITLKTTDNIKNKTIKQMHDAFLAYLLK